MAEKISLTKQKWFSILQNMIERKVEPWLMELLAGYPAVALIGPRQAGKTTLAQSVGGAYYDLEKNQDRLRLDVEWEVRSKERSLLILDEAHAMPELFPRLRSAIDEDRQRYGRFLLLGSISPALMKQVSESLAGRLALCELTPFLAQEFPATRWEDIWRFGGFADGGLLNKDRYPGWQHYYLQLMAERDLPQWGLHAQPSLTQRLYLMLGGIHGQIWNASQIGKSLGLSYHTVNAYVDFLEHAFLIRRLPAYSANLKKRLVKHPKIYWRDSGLLHALLGLEAGADLFARSWVGASWEGWIVEQLLAHLMAAGKSFQAFHLRTSDQIEIDLLLEFRNRLWAFEIKLSSVPDLNDLKRLKAAAELVKADHAILISRTTNPVRGRNEASLDLAATVEFLLA